MKKFGTLLTLLTLSMFTIGCEKSPEKKKEDAIKKEVKEENNAADAIEKGEEKKEKIDESTAKTVDKDLNKADKAMEEADDAATK